MKYYDYYKVVEYYDGTTEKFATFDEAMEYIKDRYSIDNIIELQVQIDGYNYRAILRKWLITLSTLSEAPTLSINKKIMKPKGKEEIMIIKVNGIEIGTIITNRSLTIEEAMYALGYDINDQKDCEEGYRNDVEGFYLDDYGNYCFDIDAAEMVY